jgi:hypothetical protein
MNRIHVTYDNGEEAFYNTVGEAQSAIQTAWFDNIQAETIYREDTGESFFVEHTIRLVSAE